MSSKRKAEDSTNSSKGSKKKGSDQAAKKSKHSKSSSSSSSRTVDLNVARHRVITLKDEVIPAIDPRCLLETFIYPLQKQEFLTDYFKKNVLVVRPKKANIARFESFIEDYLFDLDIRALLENTASERLFVWMKNLDTAKIDSFETDDVDAAMICYKAGASLYFRTPNAFASVFVRAMSLDLGLNFTSYQYPISGSDNPFNELPRKADARNNNKGNESDGDNDSDNDNNSESDGDGDSDSDDSIEFEELEKESPLIDKGEIETFVSRKGHVTDWHFDFMENFTFQLSGKKKWLLSPGPAHPIRGCTPHYNNVDTLEQQVKLHRLHDPEFLVKPKEPQFEVILEPGSVMYFPAGFWHRVECLEDSISINISLICTSENSTWTDLIIGGLKTQLWRKDEWREGIRIDDYQSGRAHLEALLQRFKQEVNSLQVDDLFPPALLVPRADIVHLGVAKFEVGELNEDTEFRFNPSSVLIKRSDIPEDDDETDAGSIMETTYLLHHNFGNEELVSALRAEFIVIEENIVKLVDWIKQQEKTGAHFTFGALERVAHELEVDNPNLIISAFVHYGYITKCN